MWYIAFVYKSQGSGVTSGVSKGYEHAHNTIIVTERP